MGSSPELITLATNILILSLLAISFDLCWGYSGIMSFGQAQFFGVAGYVIAPVGRDLEFSHAWGTLPLAMRVAETAYVMDRGRTAPARRPRRHALADMVPRDVHRRLP
jgi:ABC-type branched-subunit amino acid transport system permease subunit